LVGARGHHLFVKHIGRRFEAASVAVAHREASDAASPNAGSSNERLLGSAVCRLAREFERYAGSAQADAKISEEAAAVWGEIQSKTAARRTPRHIRFRMLPLE
jgi:hypothetical protein